MSDPPDINYRRFTLNDQENIDKLFENEDTSPKERCLRYEEEDASMMDDLHAEYREWTRYMLKATMREHNERRNFPFGEFYHVLYEGNKEQRREWLVLYDGQFARERQQVAKELNLPLLETDWTAEDMRRYKESEKQVVFWGIPDRYKILEELLKERRSCHRSWLMRKGNGLFRRDMLNSTALIRSAIKREDESELEAETSDDILAANFRRDRMRFGEVQGRAAAAIARSLPGTANQAAFNMNAELPSLSKVEQPSVDEITSLPVNLE